MQGLYLQLKKSMGEIKSHYEKVKKETFGQEEWTSQGRKITLSIQNFEKTKNTLIKGLDYMKKNDIDEENTTSQIEQILKTAQATDSQIQVIHDKTNYFDSNFESNSGGENEVIQAQEVMLDLVNNKEVLEQRRKELEGIHQTAAILKDTTVRMAQQLNQDKEILNTIEASVDETKQNAENTKKEIIKADELSKGNRKKMCCLISIVLVAVVTISCIMAAVFWPKDE